MKLVLELCHSLTAWTVFGEQSNRPRWWLLKLMMEMRFWMLGGFSVSQLHSHGCVYWNMTTVACPRNMLNFLVHFIIKSPPHFLLFLVNTKSHSYQLGNSWMWTCASTVSFQRGKKKHLLPQYTSLVQSQKCQFFQPESRANYAFWYLWSWTAVGSSVKPLLRCPTWEPNSNKKTHLHYMLIPILSAVYNK